MKHPQHEELIQVVRDALSLEFNGEYFYQQVAELTHHPKGKQVFLQLAEQEQGHVEEIGNLFAHLIGEEAWKQVLAETATQPRSSPVIEQLAAAVTARGHGQVADDTQALRLAMELERRAIQFFEGLKQHTDDSVMLDMIHKMAEEERFHYDFLQAQLDSVLNVGIWLDSTEFRQDGKF